MGIWFDYFEQIWIYKYIKKKLPFSRQRMFTYAGLAENVYVIKHQIPYVVSSASPFRHHICDGFLCSTAETDLNTFESGMILQVLMFFLLVLIAVPENFNMSIHDSQIWQWRCMGRLAVCWGAIRCLLSSMTCACAVLSERFVLNINQGVNCRPWLD